MKKDFCPVIKTVVCNSEVTVSFSEDCETDIKDSICSILLGIYKSRIETEMF